MYTYTFYMRLEVETGGVRSRSGLRLFPGKCVFLPSAKILQEAHPYDFVPPFSLRSYIKVRFHRAVIGENMP